MYTVLVVWLREDPEYYDFVFHGVLALLFHFFGVRCRTSVQSLFGHPKFLIRVCPIHSVSCACIIFYSSQEFGFSHLLSCLVNFPTLHHVLSERFLNETPRLMKYGEIIHDISSKPDDWYFYDKQFRYIQKSAPDQYPRDTIHLQLWLEAVINFRAKPGQLKPDMASPGTRPSQSFPKGTCCTNTMVVANWNVFSSNEVLRTQPANALSLINSVQLSPKLVQILHSRPVTPVKVDWLEYLLDSYHASLQEYLVSGFSRGFRIHFVG